MTASTQLRHDPPRPTRLQALGHAALLLATATVVALIGAGAVVLLVLHADFLTGAATAVIRLALGSGVLAVAAAASPLIVTLLIGYAYMQRGVRRRAAARAAAVAAGPGGADEHAPGGTRSS